MARSAALWLPFAAGIAGLAASFLLRHSLRRVEDEQVERLAQAHVQTVARHLEAAMEGYAESLARIALRTGGALRQRAHWPIGTKGLDAVLWVEPSGKVGWVTPLEGHRDLLGADLSTLDTDRAVLLQAASHGKPALTPSVARPAGDSSFHLVVPVLEDGRLEGFLVGVFVARTLYPAVLEADASPGWALAVVEGDRESYRHRAPIDGAWLAESKATVLGAERRLRLGATPALLAHMRSSLPNVVFLAGGVISLLFAALVGLAQRSRRRARDAEAAQAAQRRSEEQYRVLFENNPQPMWVYDQETMEILAVNESAVDHYGYSREEFLAMTLRDIRPPGEVPMLEAQVARRLKERTRSTFHSPRAVKHRKKDGALIDVEITASPIEFHERVAWLALANDVTERKQLEAQFLQAQKMESTGRLAGGIAHDFNNLLGVITGYGDLLMIRLAADDPLREKVEQIVRAARRAAGLARQLLAFSRKQVLQPEVISLNTLVREMDPMLRRLVGEDIRFKTALAADLGAVRADPGQVEQVLMNLVVNARDAMPRGGDLTVQTANAVFDAAGARIRPGLEPGPYVMLAVSDTGHGMAQEVLDHLFEPFFTTKETGKGTGLGLATVHGIVRQSGGHIFVYSEPQRGTLFKIYLPRLAAEMEAEAAPVAQPVLPRGSETVLLVEDEGALRTLVRECLETSGYTVMEARHGSEALEIARRSPSPLHLLMTDVIMPGMSGRELAERMVSGRSHLKVLYMSGYTDDTVIRHGVLAQQTAFLQKPFTAEALARKVREVLDTR